MSRYQPRILINNPEKNVPDDIREQFFLAIKTADLDKIRDFANRYKNKYNIIEKASKGSPSDSGKTPFHIVLELDDKIDNTTKLKIMEYLDQMGAPIDLPDSADIWPIHLAAALESDKIVNFLIKKKVSLNRKDSSNNTPLHYAINGKEMSCPRSVKVGSIAPSQKIDTLPLNKSLENANNALIKLISQDTNINDNLIHMINTIMKIPEMYIEDKLSRDLQTDVITIFSDIALISTFPSDISGEIKTNGMTLQQNKLEQLIDKTYSMINDDLLKGLSSPLTIAPNNSGWGPGVPIDISKNKYKPPTDSNRILEDERINITRGINNNYLLLKNSVTAIDSMPINKLIKISLPKEINIIDSEYLDKLIFCPDCATVDYGEEVALTKMLFLLSWNHYKNNYADMFADKVMNNFQLTHRTLHTQIMTAKKQPVYVKTGIGHTLFQMKLDSLIRNPAFTSVRSKFDINLVEVIDFYTIFDDKILKCTTAQLLKYISVATFTDPVPEDLFLGELRTATLNALLKKPEYNKYSADTNLFMDRYNGRISWFKMLDNTIKQIRPDGKNERDKIFSSGIAGTYEIPKTPLPNTTSPKNQLPTGTRKTYTLLELFIIMHMIGKFLTDEDFQVTDYPDIFDEKINEWYKYIDTVGGEPVSKNLVSNVASQYPEFIFLYKILVTYAQGIVKKIIRDCIQNVINIALNDKNSTNGSVKNLIKYLNPIDDAYMYNLLLPSEPHSIEFSTVPSQFGDIMKNKWDNNSDLYQWFDGFQNTDPDVTNFIIKIGYIVFEQIYIDVFNYGGLRFVRFLIETNVPANIDIIRSIIKNPKFRNKIRQYFGTSTQSTSKKLPNRNVVPRYNLITRTIVLNNVLDRKLTNLQKKSMTILFFLTEFIGYVIVKIKQLILKVTSELVLIHNIVADIVVFINNETYYYIPQIFLPALIKQVILIIRFVMTIRDELLDFDKFKLKSYDFINPTDNEYINISTLNDNFNTYINKLLKIIYEHMFDIIKYHNDVINFLNFHSGYQLAIRRKRSRMFTMNLIPIETFPDIYTNYPNFEQLLKILSLYRIPVMMYHAYKTDKTKLKYDVFSKVGGKADGEHYTFTNYRDVINFERKGTHSNCPIVGQNSQLNITASNTLATNPAYTINDIDIGIAGEWLQVDTQRPKFSFYLNAFIGYSTTKYDLKSTKWLNGMPPSIRQLAGQHLKIIKQRIIEDTIQTIFNNKNKYVSPANQDITNLYNSIKMLGNESTYLNLDDAKIYVVIGKLIDAILNKLLEYSIRQSISTWIYEFATSNYSYHNLINGVINPIVHMIQQKDYLKLSLQDVNRDAIDQLLGINPKYIDYKLTQIELDPANIKYSTKSISNDLVYYLYNVNYFSSSNISTNKKCYKINPKIVSKLIIGETINFKNSDGNTPLHIAVNLNNSDIVELLISKGANKKGFRNLHGKTPYDISLSNAEEHLKFTNGLKVIDTINNFVTPFNDLMLARLKDEKYNNNIIKNISSGIPIQLVMYNHMVHLYLQNYRYSFTIELKQSIRNLLKKYFNHDEHIYPIDLIEINDRQQLEKIIESENSKNRAATIVNTHNHKKIEFNEKQIRELNIQIDGLKKEKNQTFNQKQIQLIDQIIVQLETRISTLNSKISSLQIVGGPIVDSIDMSVYVSAVNSVNNAIDDRNINITEFYHIAFGRIGRTKNLYVKVWENYFDKKLFDAPSMIFPLLNNIINKLIIFSKEDKIDAGLKNELTIVVEFFDKVRDYIESKNSYPEIISDNPILDEEFNQIIYLINLIITPAIRNILLSQVYQALREMDGANTLIVDQTTILDEIVSIQFNGETIDSYLQNILPILAIKYFTTIYYNSDDSDKKITNASDLFLPLIQIIKSNRIIHITDDSLIIQNLREYLIPFMVNTYHNFIYHLRLAVYGYERYLLNTYQLIKILQSFI